MKFLCHPIVGTVAKVQLYDLNLEVLPSQITHVCILSILFIITFSCICYLGMVEFTNGYSITKINTYIKIENEMKWQEKDMATSFKEPPVWDEDLELLVRKHSM